MINDAENKDYLPSIMTGVAMMLIICITLAMGLLAFLVGRDMDRQHQQAIQEYDVSAIAEDWHCNNGTVRMVFAKVYEKKGSTTTLEDSTGNLWDVEGVDIEDNANVLLWLTDNHTTKDITDDVIVDVYTNTDIR